MENTAPPAGIEIPKAMRHYELPVGEETLEFWGRFVDDVDTDSGDRARWAELRLYRIIDTNPAHDDSWPYDDGFKGTFGEQIWLLYTVGHSVAYHDLYGCNKGVVMKVADFPDRAESVNDLEPCPDCRPPDWRSTDSEAELRLEITWYTYTPCPTAARLIESLYRDPRCANSSCRHKPHENRRCACGCSKYTEAPRTLSIPGRRLIEQVRNSEPEIAEAMARTRRL